MGHGSGGLIRLAWVALMAFGVLGPLSAHPATTTHDTQPLDLFDLGAPSFTTFTTRDGLPGPVTVTVRTDRQGFVWVGTPHGLAWYDGLRWHALDNPALRGYIQQLFVDHEGTLWACASTFGLARYDGKHWHVEGTADGLTDHNVRRLVETDTPAGKRLWAVTTDKGLFYRDHGRWQADPGNAQLPHGYTLALAQTHTLFGQERLWVAGSGGLWYRVPGGHWQRFRAPGFDAGNGLEYLLATRNEGHEALWISVFNSGLWRLDDHGLHHWSVATGDLPTDVLYNMVATPTPDGGQAIWASSRNGLVRIYHDRVRVFDRRYGLLSNAIRGLSLWRSPNGTCVLWLATEDGVARVIVGTHAWKAVSLLGANQTGVLGVLVDHDHDGNERLWAGSDGDGLGLYTRGRWRYFRKVGGDSVVNMIAHADDWQGQPTVWLGTGAGHLWRVDDTLHFKPVATPWPHPPGQSVNAMLSRRIGGQTEQWFATDASGIYRLREGVWTAFRPKSAHGRWEVVKLLAQTTPDGHAWLWATSNQGLARFDGTQWMLLGRDIGLPGTDLLGMRLIPDAQGKPILWLGSRAHGIIRVDASDPLQPHTLPANLPAPPDATADDALADADGRIYICTDSGVQMLTPHAGGYRSQVFTVRDGMVNNECNANAQFVDTHGRYWTGTLGGLMVHDPGALKPDHEAKPLKLIQVRMDGKPVNDDRVRVPSGHHELRVDFALLSWRHEDASRFRTWLQGFSSTPGAWTQDNFREIGALPPGDYVLHIEARDYAGNLSRPILLPIVVSPHWWQRWWAWLLFVAVAGLLVAVLLRWRTHALRRQQRALEQRIAEHTAELNNANRRLLELSHHDALTGVSNRRWLMESLQREDRGTLASLIFIDVDHFKAFNDDFGHLAGDHALREVAEAIRKHVPADALVARYGGEEFACLLRHCDLPEARVIAERMRAEVARLAVTSAGKATRQITISAGIASRHLSTEEDRETLLHDADEAQYEAKRSGRNCIRGTIRVA
ncbi:ligand-binding sensor domain-containing diguanylate cyclase [Rhodanobacter glycinis]|uniref:diguanylate cyclase n=1 Tax=Rhodanobacter glycinis TaxID=582702 RepID=A0A1I4FBQ3_9GAMM|nr:diguanylate cyclase [Rhodanobacter glycinis]SFL14216.1 diguanylate cyclase (GGDEF) domain-containing protein [Rhodanobacter glycinis]